MRGVLLAKRNFKELLREPMSLVFSLGLPAVLLCAFRLISYYANGHWMALSDLVPGVAVFSLTFMMLYMTLLVSGDRSSAFLSRLYNAPVRAVDFIVGYALPGVALGVLQSLITYAMGFLVCLVPDGKIVANGVEIATKSIDYTTLPPTSVEGTALLPFGGAFAATLATLPAIVLFVSLGILLGTLLTERAAPGVSSAVITASGLLGGAWMPLSDMGGFEKLCRFLPFYPATTLARTCFMLQAPTLENVVLPLVTVGAFAILSFVGACLCFSLKMQGRS